MMDTGHVGMKKQAALTTDQHDRHQIDRDAVVGFVIESLQVHFLLVIIDTSYQPGAVDVDADLVFGKVGIEEEEEEATGYAIIRL